MLEHLDREEAERFLSEAYRVLVPGGYLRLVVPDLRKLVEEYITDRDADRFVARTLLTRPRARTLRERMRWLVVGDRHHLWMYDGQSLREAVLKAGFRDAWILDAGVTRIPNPGVLDLRERADESVYVEATK
jgi:predicted SAM-dependent methyltransferase